MVSTWKWFLEIFWSEKVWLPPGVKWRDIENGPSKKVIYPDSDHFLYLIPMVVIILFIRYTLVKTCYEPLGRAIGVKNKIQRRPQRIPLLESAYRQSPRIILSATALAKQLDIKERQVEQWWRRRRNADKPSKLTKFCEYAWKSTYTSANTLIGLYVLWDKDFFWDLDKCVIGYPHQGINNDLWWFYTINSSIVSASIVTALFFEVRRKDFTVVLVHHVLQITLLSVAWITGWFRVAAIIGPLMDSSDFVLEVVKVCKLAKYDTAGHIIFAFFCLLWIYTRLYIYPFHLLYRTIVTAFPFMNIVGVIADTMLLVMLLLQIYWSMMVLRVCYNYFAFGASRDVRSSSSEVSDSELADKSDKEGDNSDTITVSLSL